MARSFAPNSRSICRSVSSTRASSCMRNASAASLASSERRMRCFWTTSISCCFIRHGAGVRAVIRQKLKEPVTVELRRPAGSCLIIQHLCSNPQPTFTAGVPPTLSRYRCWNGLCVRAFTRPWNLPAAAPLRCKSARPPATAAPLLPARRAASAVHPTLCLYAIRCELFSAFPSAAMACKQYGAQGPG